MPEIEEAGNDRNITKGSRVELIEGMAGHWTIKDGVEYGKTYVVASIGDSFLSLHGTRQGFILHLHEFRLVEE